MHQLVVYPRWYTTRVRTGEELCDITRPSRSDRPGKAPGRYDFIEVAPADSNVDAKLTSHVEALEKVPLRARSGAAVFVHVQVR